MNSDIVLVVADYLSDDDCHQLSFVNKKYRTYLNSESWYHYRFLHCYGAKPSPSPESWRHLYNTSKRVIQCYDQGKMYLIRDHHPRYISGPVMIDIYDQPHFLPDLIFSFSGHVDRKEFLLQHRFKESVHYHVRRLFCLYHEYLVYLTHTHGLRLMIIASVNTDILLAKNVTAATCLTTDDDSCLHLLIQREGKLYYNRSHIDTINKIPFREHEVVVSFDDTTKVIKEFGLTPSHIYSSLEGFNLSLWIRSTDNCLYRGHLILDYPCRVSYVGPCFYLTNVKGFLCYLKSPTKLELHNEPWSRSSVSMEVLVRENEGRMIFDSLESTCSSDIQYLVDAGALNKCGYCLE